MPHGLHDSCERYSVYDHSPHPGMETANQRVLRHLEGLHTTQNPIAQLRELRKMDNWRVGVYRPKQAIGKPAFTTNTVLDDDLAGYMAQF